MSPVTAATEPLANVKVQGMQMLMQCTNVALQQAETYLRSHSVQSLKIITKETNIS